MKKKFSIIFLFLFSFILGNAQPYNGNAKGVWYEPDTLRSYDIDYDTDDLLFINEFVYDYDLNDLGLIIVKEEKYWDFDAEIYISNTKETFTYNDENLLESETMSYWDGWDGEDNVWRNTSKIEYTYVNGKVESEAHSSWNDSIGVFVYTTKSVTSYDEHNNPISHKYFSWNGTDWTGGYAGQDFVNGYDSLFNLISQIEIVVPDSIYIYYYSFTYDEHGNVLTDTLDRKVNGVYEKLYFNFYSYDANHNLLSRTTMEWKNDEEEYLYASWNGRITYTYDANNNRTSHVRETFDYNIMAWRVDGWNPKIEWTYLDDNAVLIRSFYFDESTGEWVNGTSGHVDLLYNNMKSQYELMFGGHQFEISYRKFELTTQIKQEIVYPIHCYPNPTTEKIYFSGISEPNYVTIYDFTGKIVDRQIITTNGQSINVKHLNSGIYFVDIKNEIQHSIRKIIKQ